MNLGWAASLDHLLSSPESPTWLILAAGGSFVLIVLIAMSRASKSAANGALIVITMASIGIAVVATTQGGAPGNRGASSETDYPQQVNAALPALSCIDDMAGDAVLAACEKALFSSAESAAAAVSYAAAQLTRLTELGDAAVADRSMSPQLLRLRRAIERDRYGLMAQVLVMRDRCKPTACAAFRALKDKRQIVANMDERRYDSLVARYAPSWNEPAAPAPLTAAAPATAAAPMSESVAALPSSLPTGKPTNAEFPSAASTPAVSIMTPEPGAPAALRSSPSSPAESARLLSPRPTASVPPATAAAKKQAAPRPQRAPAPPIQLAPATANARARE
jgi:hypothetical protein